MDRKVNYIKGKESWQEETHSLNIPIHRNAHGEDTADIEKLTDSIKYLASDLGEDQKIQNGSSLNIPHPSATAKQVSSPEARGSAKPASVPELKKPTAASNSFDIPKASRPKQAAPTVKTPAVPKETPAAAEPKTAASPSVPKQSSSFAIPHQNQKTAADKPAPAKQTATKEDSFTIPEAAKHIEPSAEPVPAEPVPLPKDSKPREEEKHSFNEELTQIFKRKPKETPKKPSYSERMAVGMKFYQHLLIVFLVTCMICGAGLGYLWFWLSRYESHSVNGAVRSYLKQITNGEWDAIYEEDCTYFIELNSKDKYISWLQQKYDALTISELTYSFTDADDLSQYYTLYDGSSNRIGTLELRKPDNKSSWVVRTLNTSLSYDFDVLDNTAFSINNVSIDSSYTNESDHVPYGFENLGLDDKLPTVTRYSIKNFVDDPDVTVDNSSANMAVRDWSANQYYIGPAATDDQYTEFAQEIQDTTTAYCEYISKDGTFTALNRHLYPNTDFYNNMIGFNNQYYSSHDTIEFQNTRIYDVMPLGDNAFIGSISFDYAVTASDVSRTTSSSYQLFFVKNSAGSWKLTNLIIISSDNGNEDTTAESATASPTAG
ncbi:MAG: hypothetical protein LKF50_08165 [Solobacterium sp.]|jgi:hypothetical protein|nr:hypothetical protein [Solobacterium sp.]MCH4222841.1 hypothetical protein [Solobacterium sp.]